MSIYLSLPYFLGITFNFFNIFFFMAEKIVLVTAGGHIASFHAAMNGMYSFLEEKAKGRFGLSEYDLATHFLFYSFGDLSLNTGATTTAYTAIVIYAFNCCLIKTISFF